MYNHQPWDYQAMQGYGMPQQQHQVPMAKHQMPHMQMPQPMMPQFPNGAQPPAGMPGMPGTPEPVPPGMGGQFPGLPTEPGMLPMEQSYIENILRLNRGKLGTFYFTYENNAEWNAVVYRGFVEEAGRDHIIIRDAETDRHYLLLMVNFDYATFDEHLEYQYPYGQPGAAAPELDEYPPR